MRHSEKQSKEKEQLSKHTPTNSGCHPSVKKSQSKKVTNHSNRNFIPNSEQSSLRFLKNKIIPGAILSRLSDDIMGEFAKTTYLERNALEAARSPTKAKLIKPVPDKAREEIERSLVNVAKACYTTNKDCLNVSLNEIGCSTHHQAHFSRTDFTLLQAIGEGAFSKVWKSQHNRSHKFYAIKLMSKPMIMLKKSVDNVLNERSILQDLKSPLLANMHFAFQDRDFLYLVLDMLSGGDLRWLLSKDQSLSEEKAKFALACIIGAVEYVHSRGIFHRDIKPENLVFDSQGYLRLTDFGIARKESATKALDTSGTPGYMAPEVLCSQTHSYPVDFYAIGVLTYQLALGKRPYPGVSRNQVREAVLARQPCITKNDLPTGWSIDAVDFINKLLQRTPANRLGSRRGADELKIHPWLKKFNWTFFETKKMKSPFKIREGPVLANESVERYQEAIAQVRLLERTGSSIDLFRDYNY